MKIYGYALETDDGEHLARFSTKAEAETAKAAREDENVCREAEGWGKAKPLTVRPIYDRRWA